MRSFPLSALAGGALSAALSAGAPQSAPSLAHVVQRMGRRLETR